MESKIATSVRTIARKFSACPWTVREALKKLSPDELQRFKLLSLTAKPANTWETFERDMRSAVRGKIGVISVKLSQADI